jgi:archaellum component FlaG (FlaF/FlaG flagellin family)
MVLLTIAVGVAFITYLFVMNCLALSTTKSGKAIEIQSMNKTDESLTVYVQNTGKETAIFDPASCIYVNGKLENSTMNKTTILTGETGTITVNSFTGETKVLKVTTTDGTSTEATLQ